MKCLKNSQIHSYMSKHIGHVHAKFDSHLSTLAVEDVCGVMAKCGFLELVGLAR